MKKILPLFLPVFIFSSSLIYLHQKIQIYVEAYRLSNNYHCHNELVDKRDYLMYNLAKEVSLAKVNQWAQAQNFTPVDKGKVLALNIKAQEQIHENTINSVLNRLLRASVSTSTALAKERR
jgi:hypothetical protein